MLSVSGQCTVVVFIQDLMLLVSLNDKHRNTVDISMATSRSCPIRTPEYNTF